MKGKIVGESTHLANGMALAGVVPRDWLPLDAPGAGAET